MNLLKLFVAIASLILLQACIGDDYINDTVDPDLRITSRVDTIEINSTFQFEHIYFNNIGAEEEIEVVWRSSNSDIIDITPAGSADALILGSATITVEADVANQTIIDEIIVNVGNETTVGMSASKEGQIKTTSSYALTGDFIFSEFDDGVMLSLEDNYQASTALPGLYIYLSNNRNSIANALEIGKVTTFSGAHSYDIPNVGIDDYDFIVYFCKPFNVKVGEGEL
jgi:hypothetical protein